MEPLSLVVRKLSSNYRLCEDSVNPRDRDSIQEDLISVQDSLRSCALLQPIPQHLTNGNWVYNMGTIFFNSHAKTQVTGRSWASKWTHCAQFFGGRDTTPPIWLKNCLQCGYSTMYTSSPGPDPVRWFCFAVLPFLPFGPGLVWLQGLGKKLSPWWQPLSGLNITFPGTRLTYGRIEICHPSTTTWANMSLVL